MFLLGRTGPLAKKISNALRVQMVRQSWSLEPTQIAAVLFSDNVSNLEKSRIASRILALKPADFSFPDPDQPPAPPFPAPNAPIIQPSKDDIHRGKPPLPTEMSSSQTLVDFVTPRSIIFLARFCPNAEKWLKQNPPWDHIPEFVEAKKIVHGIMAVNDPAERLCATAKKYKVKRETSRLQSFQMTHQFSFRIQ